MIYFSTFQINYFQSYVVKRKLRYMFYLLEETKTVYYRYSKLILYHFLCFNMLYFKVSKFAQIWYFFHLFTFLFLVDQLVIVYVYSWSSYIPSGTQGMQQSYWNGNCSPVWQKRYNLHFNLPLLWIITPLIKSPHFSFGFYEALSI